MQLIKGKLQFEFLKKEYCLRLWNLIKTLDLLWPQFSIKRATVPTFQGFLECNVIYACSTLSR